MISRMITISSRAGFHLRPVGDLCNEAMKYKCRIHFRYRGVTANVKSVLSVLGAGVRGGSEIELICEGEGEKEAFQRMIELIEGGFGE